MLRNNNAMLHSQPTMMSAVTTRATAAAVATAPSMDSDGESSVREGSIAKKRSSKSENSAPVFLRKTYHMIDTCDPNIATWSKDGYTFVVKDTERFASDIIGQFFKHKNFSSFVRQLNFYGFRKIKNDPLRLRDAMTDVESKYWRFKHEKFQRGRPDLLTEIRKSNHTETADKQEVDVLKREVSELRGKIAIMSADMEKLASLVGSLMKNQHMQMSQQASSQQQPVSMQPVPAQPVSVQPPHHPPYTAEDGPPAKRRALDQPDKLSQQVDPFRPIPVSSLALTDPAIGATGSASSSPFGGENSGPAPAPAKPPLPRPPTFPRPTRRASRQGSLASLTSVDEEILSSLFAMDQNDGHGGVKEAKEAAVPVNAPASVPLALSEPISVSKPMNAVVSKKSSPQDGPDSEIIRKLRESLSLLPLNMQELFVERLVFTISNPDSFKEQVQAINTLANAAAQEAKKRLESIGGGEADDQQSVALATAVLGAFLSRYSAAFCHGPSSSTSSNDNSPESQGPC